MSIYQKYASGQFSSGSKIKSAVKLKDPTFSSPSHFGDHNQINTSQFYAVNGQINTLEEKIESLTSLVKILQSTVNTQEVESKKLKTELSNCVNSGTFNTESCIKDDQKFVYFIF